MDFFEKIEKAEKIEGLYGLDTQAAKEYMLGVMSTLRLTEKALEDLKEEEAKWEGRKKLAFEQGKAELLAAAEKESEKAKEKRLLLEEEAVELRASLKGLKEEYLVLPSRERSIDPDLLEQELLILSGRMPGEDLCMAKELEKLEKEAEAEAALKALKARMKA